MGQTALEFFDLVLPVFEFSAQVFDLLVKALNSTQSHAIGVAGANVPVIFADLKRRFEILRHDSYVPNFRRLSFEVPGSDWHGNDLFQDGSAIHRFEVLLHIAVADRAPGIAAVVEGARVVGL